MNDFEFIEGYSANSASPTDIWKVRKKSDGKYFIIKIFVIQLNLDKYYLNTEDSALLLHEQNVYKYLKKDVVVEENARNILPLYSEGSMTYKQLLNILTTSKKNSKEQLESNFIYNLLALIFKHTSRIAVSEKNSKIDLSYLYNYEYNKKQYVLNLHDCTYGYICTPAINQLTLSDYFSKEFDMRKIMRYIFLVFLNTMILSANGINQNDLHWGNILMSNKFYGYTEYYNKDYLLIFGNLVLVIRNTYIPIIYDFDRSAVNGQEIKLLKGYEYAGNCPNFHPNRDVLKTICNIYHYLEDKRSQDKSNSGFYKDIQHRMLQTLVKKQSLREAIIDSSNASCWFETNANVSRLCLTADLNALESTQQMMSFTLQYADYDMYTTDIFNSDSNIPKNVESLFSNYKGSKLNQYIKANTQFVGVVAPDDKDKILKKIGKDVRTRKIFGVPIPNPVIGII